MTSQQSLITRIVVSTLLTSIGYSSALAFDLNKKLYPPAEQCLAVAGRMMTNLEAHLSTAAAADDPVTMASKNLNGGLANVAISLVGPPPNDVWKITGSLRNRGCGILSDAAMVCYLVDPCDNRIGPTTSYSCNNTWWSGLDSALFQVSCHLTLRSSNIDIFSNHSRICSALTSSMVQGRTFFDIVSADGASECNIF